MQSFRLLCLGDVVGERAVSFLSSRLWQLRKELRADAVVVNAENACNFNGITPDIAETLLSAGADVLTLGNHAFRQKNVYSYLDDSLSVIRPANYHGSCPGNGSTVVEAAGLRLLVCNLVGAVYMDPVASPFDTVDRILDARKGEYDLCAVDFHAEATSEKRALGFYLDGRVSAVFGTHTHVPTADETVLPLGTGYVTDLGMCGPDNSVLGVRREIIVARMRTGMPERFHYADEATVCTGVLFEIDRQSKKTVSAERVSLREETAKEKS